MAEAHLQVKRNGQSSFAGKRECPRLIVFLRTLGFLFGLDLCSNLHKKYNLEMTFLVSFSPIFVSSSLPQSDFFFLKISVDLRIFCSYVGTVHL